MNLKEDIMNHFNKFDVIINELRAHSGVTTINDEQFLVSLLLRSMRADFANNVTAIVMISREDLKLDIMKSIQYFEITVCQSKIFLNFLFYLQHKLRKQRKVK